MSKRAPFIVIEGLDRSGKSTQTALLLAQMEAAGMPAKLLKFPGIYLPVIRHHPENLIPKYLSRSHNSDWTDD